MLLFKGEGKDVKKCKNYENKEIYIYTIKIKNKLKETWRSLKCGHVGLSVCLRYCIVMHNRFGNWLFWFHPPLASQP